MPHVLDLKWYFGVWIMLMVFTVITVAVSYVDFGVLNLVIAVVVATMKATMVSLIFMHLAFDHKFNGIAFLSSLVFLAIFIGFAMTDMNSRGIAEGIEGEHPVKLDEPFGPLRSERDRELRARLKAEKAAGHAEGAAAHH